MKKLIISILQIIVKELEDNKDKDYASLREDLKAIVVKHRNDDLAKTVGSKIKSDETRESFKNDLDKATTDNPEKVNSEDIEKVRRLVAEASDMEGQNVFKAVAEKVNADQAAIEQNLRIQELIKLVSDEVELEEAEADLDSVRKKNPSDSDKIATV
jgi:hypothetical protein